ncbi:MAG: hypothetical protein ACI934_000540 [Pseudohongiellaceae bacterium]|jgi:hypothetical protein
MNITTATMLESDLLPISTIQSENLRENLASDQLEDGYLSIAFSENEFKSFNGDLGVVVAREQDKVVAYSCFSSAAFNKQFPIIGQIIANLSSYIIPGTEQQPAEAKTCVYGPACIAADFRGQNILARMFSYGEKLAKNAGFFFCVSFISLENQRSLKAHLKLPFQKVGQVTYNDNQYIVIACKL